MPEVPATDPDLSSPAAESVPSGPAATQLDRALGTPDRIGRFVVHAEIGRGSNGIVDSATDPVLGRKVAIKAMPLLGSKGISERLPTFLQEAKTAAGLNHPGIVTIFDAGQTERMAYIAMERLEGVDLHHWLADHRVMPPRNAAALIARIADALHFAHRRGLVHRDIKPSNIFLSQDLKPKVLDFGVAVMANQQTMSRLSARLIGTPNYMSPEQAQGLPLDSRSDVFSLGCILYELLTGHRAFAADSVEATLSQVVRERPPAINHWRPDIEPQLVTIVDRAMEKEPRNRYQSAAQLRNDLAAFAGRPVSPATQSIAFNPATLIPTMARPSWRRAGLIAAVSGLCTVLVVFGMWLGRQPSLAGAPEPQTAAAPLPAPVVSNPAPPSEPPAPPASAPGSSTTGSASGSQHRSTAAPAAARHPSPDSRSAPAEPVPAPAPEPVEAAPVVPGYLALAVVPWGQVFVDGESVGVSPPLSRFPLPVGEHTIEVRNGGAPEYMTEVHVVAGQTVFIQHRF